MVAVSCMLHLVLYWSWWMDAMSYSTQSRSYGHRRFAQLVVRLAKDSSSSLPSGNRGYVASKSMPGKSLSSGAGGVVVATKSSTNEDEKILRKSIADSKFGNARQVLANFYSTTQLKSGRNIVFIIAESCRRNRHYEAILPLLESIPMSKLDCSEDDVMPLLSECAKYNNMRIAQPIVSFLDRKGVQLTAKTFSVLVKGYGRAKNELMVDRVIQWCNLRHIAADTILLNSIMDAYIRCDNSKKTIAIFSLLSGQMEVSAARSNSSTAAVSELQAEQEHTPELENKDYSASVVVYSTNDKSWEQQRLQQYQTVVPGLADMDFLLHSSDVEFNVRTYNTLLKATRGTTNESFAHCLEIVHERMKKQHLQPDMITMNTLIDAAVLSRNLAHAERLLHDSPDLPGVEAYTSVMTGFAARADITGAFGILELMAQRNVAPNAYTLTSLMTACIASGRFNRAKELLRRSAGTGSVSSTAASTTGSSTAAAAAAAAAASSGGGSGDVGVSDKVSELVEQIELTRQDLTALHGAYVIGVCRMHNQLYDTEEQYHQHQHYTYTSTASSSSGSSGNGGNQRPLDMLYGETEEDDDKEEEEEEEEEEELKRQEYLTKSRKLRAKYLYDAQLALLEMERKSIRPDINTMNAFIQSLNKYASPSSSSPSFTTSAAKDAPEFSKTCVSMSLLLLKTMIDMGIEPDDYTYSILFTALGKQGLVCQAMKLYQSAALKRDMDTAAVNSLIRAFVSGPEPTYGIGLFYELTETADVPVVETEPKQTAVLSQNKEENEDDVGLRGVTGSNSSSGSSSIGFTNVNSNFFTPDKVTFTILFLALARSLSPRESVLGSLGSMRSGSGSGSDPSTGARMSRPRPAIDGSYVAGSSASSSSSSSKSKSMLKRPYILSSCKTASPLVHVYQKLGIVDVIITDESADRRQQEEEEQPPQQQPSDIISAPSKAPTTTATTTAAAAAGGTSSIAAIQWADHVKERPDKVLLNLYNSMRNTYRIEPDSIMIRSINAMFAAPVKGPTQQKSTFRGFSKEVARYMFEDLVISAGAHPRDLTNVLHTCAYPKRTTMRYLNDEEILKKLRSSAATYRIFKNHGWNKVESGWSPFF